MLLYMYIIIELYITIKFVNNHTIHYLPCAYNIATYFYYSVWVDQTGVYMYVCMCMDMWESFSGMYTHKNTTDYYCN